MVFKSHYAVLDIAGEWLFCSFLEFFSFIWFGLFSHLLSKNFWFGSTTNITFYFANCHNFVSPRIFFSRNLLFYLRLDNEGLPSSNFFLNRSYYWKIEDSGVALGSWFFTFSFPGLKFIFIAKLLITSFWLKNYSI